MYEPADDEPPSRAVTAVVAALTDRSQLELEPFGRTVDAEALDDLLATAEEGARPVVRFEYEGCEVRVFADGRIAATEIDGD